MRAAHFLLREKFIFFFMKFLFFSKKLSYQSKVNDDVLYMSALFARTGLSISILDNFCKRI
jgi:hypothetical protein